MTPAGPAGRGGALDALRFMAAMLIVLYHFGTEAPVALERLHPVFARGYLATDFFLILSGFVLGRAYGAQVLGGRIGLFSFLKKRLARIWPGQLVVLAGLAMVVAAATAAGFSPDNPENFTASSMLMQVLMVQAWGFEGGGGWNHQSWSLSALLVCYAAFPLAWVWISRLKSTSALLSLGLLSVIIGDLLCVALLDHHIYDLNFHLGVVRAAPLFLLGVCIARVVEQGRPPVRLARVMAVLSLAAVALLQVAGRFDLPSIVAIAAIVLSFGRLPVARPSAMIETGAKLSFALFITHSLTGLVWFGALGVLRERIGLPLWLDWTIWAAAVPAALITAALFHRLIDDPIQKWLNGLLKGRARAAEGAAVGA
jgi:peptidoglycan/LPS O-acetylase OafA/YrhL